MLEDERIAGIRKSPEKKRDSVLHFGSQKHLLDGSYPAADTARIEMMYLRMLSSLFALDLSLIQSFNFLQRENATTPNQFSLGPKIYLFPTVFGRRWNQ